MAVGLKEASPRPNFASVSTMLPDCHHNLFLEEGGRLDEGVVCGVGEGRWTAYQRPVLVSYHLSCSVLMAVFASSP